MLQKGRSPYTSARPGLTLSGVSLATPQRTQATHVTWRLWFMVLGAATPHTTDLTRRVWNPPQPFGQHAPRRSPGRSLRQSAGAGHRFLRGCRPILTSLESAERERGGETVAPRQPVGSPRRLGCCVRWCEWVLEDIHDDVCGLRGSNE